MDLPGLSPRLLDISMTIGKSMAATACSDIMKDRAAASRKTVKRRPLGEPPNLSSIYRASLFDMPECMTAPARMNAPRMKKTASFPKRE